MKPIILFIFSLLTTATRVYAADIALKCEGKTIYSKGESDHRIITVMVNSDNGYIYGYQYPIAPGCVDESSKTKLELTSNLIKNTCESKTGYSVITIDRYSLLFNSYTSFRDNRMGIWRGVFKCNLAEHRRL